MGDGSAIAKTMPQVIGGNGQCHCAHVGSLTKLVDATAKTKLSSQYEYTNIHMPKHSAFVYHIGFIDKGARRLAEAWSRQRVKDGANWL